METTLAGKQLPTYLYNAAGVRCTSYEELDNLTALPTGAVLTKSCTRMPNIGNPPPTYWSNGKFSINANGLTNYGVQYYIDYPHSTDKPYIISTVDPMCIQRIDEYAGCDIIEYNNSCPNVKEEESVGETTIRKVIEATVIPIGIKVRPMFRADEYIEFAEFVGRIGLKFVTAINSIPNCLHLEHNSPVVSAGFGGMGGKNILPIAQSNVAFHRHYLSSNVDVVACGGVSSVEDIQTYRQLGAAAVQIGTAFQDNPDIFTEILSSPPVEHSN